MAPSIIFLVPYRNRELEKIRFSIYMNYILEDYSKNYYEIYYCHQNDNREFNRGATKNIGFLIAKNKYPDNYKDITFIFNDIDCLPIKKNTLDFDTCVNVIKHIYGFNYTLGGIFSIKGIDYEKCNGFPNNWGWGLEDNVFNTRVLKNKLKIDRTNLHPINSKDIMHFADDKYKLVNNKDIDNYVNNKLYDNLNSITNLNYDIIENDEDTNIKLNNQYIININNFNTLYNYNDNDFFYKDLSKSKQLEYKAVKLNKYDINNRWNMNMYKKTI